MMATEQKLLQDGKPPTRGEQKEPLKSYEKDIKTLNSFFVDRRIFIRFHMIYKKLVTNCAGAAFLVNAVLCYNDSWKELAKLYHILCTSPQCSKLFKDTSKVHCGEAMLDCCIERGVQIWIDEDQFNVCSRWS